ncbi:hypothetical protein QWY31_04500 [Cytophagales bacterium LB-30]|uniref:Glycosyltransferase RgtA/B/C/D-like domain-containing protein n=1 Tax=Shiella aurantiaca TaxID=3058365 RepID=A0ABT8F365_9BACT|nr:hypothetical protein [Shiella aurantiaca]MDN4164748.1 hypothetical protein [Shiella aurantiaca]
MTSQDLIVTPLLLLLVYFGAWFLRPYLSDELTKRYFLPALTVKIIGALAVGLIYQFYYGGGDTFNFYYYGTKHVYAAFQDSLITGFKMLIAHGEYEPDTYRYASRIFWFRDPSSYFVIKVASLFAFFTFNTYSAIAVCFAVFSFTGLWAFYKAFYYFFPALHKQLAFAILFVPSVFFWGSGLLKDTLTLGALGWMVWGVMNLFFAKRKYLISILLVAISAYIIGKVKVYILLSILPALLVWVIWDKRNAIANATLRRLVGPVLLVVGFVFGYVIMQVVVDEKSKYALDNIARTAQITAYDIRYWTGKDAGSGYTLGDLDGTWQSMLTLAPAAINVSLYRPYLWEVRNPIMLLAALESLGMLLFTLWVWYTVGLATMGRIIMAKSEVLFCFSFSLIFAFAVGVSTYNFGSLVRYKIPLIPFYLIALFLIQFYANRPRKSPVRETME